MHIAVAEIQGVVLLSWVLLIRLLNRILSVAPAEIRMIVVVRMIGGWHRLLRSLKVAHELS